MEREQILFDVVANNRRHANYKRTVEIRKLARQLSTGEDIDELMRQFVKRETSDEFEQRKTITQHITTSVIGSLMNSFQKVGRSTGIKTDLYYDNDESGEKLKELTDILYKFYGNKTPKQYLDVRKWELNTTDPNAWITIQWDSFDNTEERLQPYPVEYSANEAIYFQFTNQILDFLITEQEKEEVRVIKNENRLVKYLVYTMFLKDETIQLVEVEKEELMTTALLKGQLTKVTGQDFTGYIELNNKFYKFIEYTPHNSDSVPAFRIGYKRDLMTDGEIFNVPYDNAIPYLKKSIKAVSEMDLTSSLHAFPQKFQYYQPCNAKGCYNGKINNTDKICAVCNGTGLQIHTSAQDSISLRLPKTPDEMLPLEQLVHYASPETALLTWQKEYIDHLTDMCSKAMYSSDIYTKKEVAETATGQNIDQQAVYDVLYPYAMSLKSNWEFTVEMIAQLTELQKDLVVKMSVSKDFKLLTEADIIFNLKNVNESGADPSVVRDIQRDLIVLRYSDQPEELLKWEVKQTFYPFSGVSKEEIMLLMNGSYVPKFVKTLYANYGYVFDEIEREVGIEFYYWVEKKQWEKITQKVEEIIASIGNDQQMIETV